MCRNSLALLLAFAVAACNSGQVHRYSANTGDEHDEEHHEAHNPSEIVFDEHRQELFGVVCRKVESGAMPESVRAGGHLAASSNGQITLVAPASGIVRFAKGGLATGMSVSPGTVLAVISTEGVVGGDRIAKARAAYEAAKSEYLRDSVLVQDNIVTALHYEESRLAYTNARLELEALTGGVIDGPIEVRSDFSGRIESVRVSNGEYVDAGQPVAVVRAGHLLELQVDVPVRYATMAADCKDARLLTVRGDAVTVRGLGGYVVGCSQNAVDGYLALTFIVPQTDGLIAGVPTDVWLLPDTGKTGLSIPAQAVIEEQGVTSVFVRLDEDCFEKREVVLGNCDGSRYEVLKGLSEGEDIVVEGAMHIKLATIQAIPHGHSHNH